jgi:hypothetical protein
VLTIALYGSAQGPAGVSATRLMSEDAIGCSDPDHRAAMRFVEACRAICDRG